MLTLDFSGSGLSDGDYVSLGWHEVLPFPCLACIVLVVLVIYEKLFVYVSER